jgi:hypothetical protein
VKNYSEQIGPIGIFYMGMMAATPFVDQNKVSFALN